MNALLPEHISTVVFDVGNTLHHLDHAFIARTVSSAGHPVGTHDVAIAEYNAKAAVDAMFVARTVGRDDERRVPYFQIILESLGVPVPAHDEILSALRVEDARQSLWRVMHPRTPDVLAELRSRGFTLAVVSNADGRVPASLAACGITEHFTAIIDSHLVGVEKPDPRIFLLALEACGAAPSEAVYVGDIYEVDIRGARRAGVNAVLIDPLGRYGDVDCPRVASLDELLELLPRRAGRAQPAY